MTDQSESTPIDQLLATLETLTLDEIDAQIAQVDLQITAATAPLVRRREALQSLRKVVSVSLQGAPARATRKPRTPRSAPAQSTAPSEAAETQPRPRWPLRPAVQVIADAVAVSYGSAYSCLNSRPAVFKKTGPGEFGLGRVSR